jgi:hypothetical protein
MADADDEEADNTVRIDAGPAYNTAAWQTADNHGAQCSQNGGFCFLCQEARKEPRNEDAPADAIDIHNDAPDDGSRDQVAKIESIVSTLVAEGKERPIIVQKIYALYNKRIRHTVKYRDFQTNMVVERPEWTRESIDRHITYSGLWPEVFDSTVDSTIQSILENQNRFMLDRSTGRVIPERVAEYIKTGEFYVKWKTCKTKTARGSACKRSGVVGTRQD